MLVVNTEEKQMSLIKGYFLREEDFQKLLNIEQRLHAGSDAMRDEGHRVWLILNNIEGWESMTLNTETSKYEHGGL